jgi:4-amino-4-deoxy-L-arabinose transferase-like glycosyltransferase
LKGENQSDANMTLQQKCDLENFKMVVEHFNQDLREYFNRANFYLVTNAGILSAFLIVYPTIMNEHMLIVLLVPILGVVISALWFLVLRGALFWIQKWRKELIKLSKELDRFQCFASVETLYNVNKSKSPSYLTLFVPTVFLLAWIAILAIVILELLYGVGGFWSIMT